MTRESFVPTHDKKENKGYCAKINTQLAKCGNMIFCSLSSEIAGTVSILIYPIMDAIMNIYYVFKILLTLFLQNVIQMNGRIGDYFHSKMPMVLRKNKSWPSVSLFTC